MESMETVMTGALAQGRVNVAKVLQAQVVSCVNAVTLGRSAQVTCSKP